MWHNQVSIIKMASGLSVVMSSEMSAACRTLQCFYEHKVLCMFSLFSRSGCECDDWHNVYYFAS